MNVGDLLQELNAMGARLIPSSVGKLKLAANNENVLPKAIELAKPNKSALLTMLERSADLPPCPQCKGMLLAVPTFDGYENFECIPCDICTGCKKVVT